MSNKTSGAQSSALNPRQTTGSLSQSEPVYLEIGLLQRPHGVRGDMILNIYRDCESFIQAGKTLWIGKRYEAFHIQSVKGHDQRVIVHFEELSNPEDARNYSNSSVYIPESLLLAAKPGQVFEYQLIGFRVIHVDGTPIGVLREIIRTGSAPVYLVIDEAGKEQLFPAIPEVILDVDEVRKVICVRPQEWE